MSGGVSEALQDALRPYCPNCVVLTIWHDPDFGWVFEVEDCNGSAGRTFRSLYEVAATAPNPSRQWCSGGAA